MSADQIASAGGRQAVSVAGVRLVDPLIVAAVVLAAALLGIALRPVGLLSAFWPANAILLGLLVRYQGWLDPDTQNHAPAAPTPQ